MRRIIDNYLQSYVYKTCARMWLYEWAAAKNEGIIQRFHGRRGFVPSYMVDFIYQTPSHFRTSIDDPNISVLHKFVLLSGLQKYYPNSSIYALNNFYRRQALNFDTNFMVGEYELTTLEVLLLCQVVLKKYYGKNVDICRYLKHLPIFIPWQSLTYPLRRFSVAQRKDILSKFGKLITTYTESANQIRQDMNISIF